jgi:ferredoxin-NADP reductase/Na+-translocating ferredoxin:NAD+ oxidoreductase RnfD subunit
MNIATVIDNLLNRITMYRLVLYYLILLLLVAAAFGAFGILPYSPLAIAFSTLVLIFVSWITNELFALLFKAPTNVESVYITSLILALIIPPVMPSVSLLTSALVWGAVWAMASKYIFAVNKKHLFNPAAFGVAVTGLAMNQPANWWISGNIATFWIVLVGGLLIVRKVQRLDLVLTFFAFALATTALTYYHAPLAAMEQALLRSPMLFFAFIILTEPLTTPPTKDLRMPYGGLVGFLFSPLIHIGAIYSTPELAILVGNMFSYIISPKGRHVLTLRRGKKVGVDTYDFSFTPDRPIKFQPGQYVEWTLTHSHPDSRGNRRYFTLASSPTESDVHLGVKFYEPASSFKQGLAAMHKGEQLVAAQVAGDFVLPQNKKKKMAFIAGGIGITPFRSMIKYLCDKNERRSVVLMYSARTAEDIAYQEVFEEAERTIGLRTIYATTDLSESPIPIRGRKGHIDEKMIAAEIPDYKDRLIYVSGTRSMVESIRTTLKKMGLSNNQIKTDFFPGFA